MKNNKWLTYTLGILLTLVVLIAVAGAGFRVGMMQNTSFTRPAFAHNLNGAPQGMQQDKGYSQAMQGNFHDNGGPQAMQGNSQGRGFERGNQRGEDRRGGMSFFSPVFGLIRLVVLGLLAWIGYKFVKKSGWRLSRVEATAAPTAKETASVEVEEKKESE
jgi:hypothetical protein